MSQLAQAVQQQVDEMTRGETTGGGEKMAKTKKKATTKKAKATTKNASKQAAGPKAPRASVHQISGALTAVEAGGANAIKLMFTEGRVSLTPNVAQDKRTEVRDALMAALKKLL